jgi:hypothetical protein
VGNITNSPPLFADQTNGDFRLQPTSPCINAGNNAYVSGATDFDGNPRIIVDTVDMGAYEFQTPTSAISYSWLQQYGFPEDGSADFTDPDGDRMNNWQEWQADAIPTNALSYLRMLSATASGSGVRLTWQSFNTRRYWLERASNLPTPAAFSVIASNLAGQVGTTSYTDTTAMGSGPYFYRVGVKP